MKKIFFILGLALMALPVTAGVIVGGKKTVKVAPKDGENMEKFEVPVGKEMDPEFLEDKYYDNYGNKIHNIVKDAQDAEAYD